MVALRLFLPENWTNDRRRLERAGVPAEYPTSRTKPQMALAEIDRVIAAGVHFGCVLAVTAGPPWPWIVAVPPTTVPPAGPPAAGAAPSARSAAVMSRRLRKRGCMAPVPLRPSVRMKENRHVFP